MIHPIPHWYKSSPLWPIPQDWEVLELWDIVKIYLWLTYTPEYTITWVPFLSVKDMSSWKIDFTNTKFISRDEYIKSTSNAKPKIWDILFGRVWTLWRPIIIDKDIDICIFVSLWFLRIVKQQSYNFFIVHWMNSDIFTKQIQSKISWSSQKNLNTWWLSKFLIPLPPLPEQYAIASILSTCDETITTTQTLIDRLQRRHKSLCQQLLTGKKRVQGFGSKWEVVKLWDIIEFHEEKTKETNKYVVFTSSKQWLILQTEYYGNSRLTERDNTWFNVVPDWFITYRSRSDDAKFTFNINNYWVTWIVSKYYPVFRLKNWSNYILVQILNMYQSKIWSYSIWTSQLVLGTKELKNIILKIPSPAEQNSIASILNESQMQIDLAQAKLTKLKQHKQGLMQQLLTGKTRVPSEYL